MANEDLRISYHVPSDRLHVKVPVEAIEELLAPWNGRRRAYLVALLNGGTKKLAAARAGVTPRASQLWVKADARFAKAVGDAEHFGFASLVEPELYARAMDRGDPGSMRALELVLRSRSEDYRTGGPDRHRRSVVVRDSRA